MNNSIRMIVFIVILGTITSVLLLAADAITKDRIEANERFFLQSTILDASNISYTTGNINDVFTQNIEVVTTSELTFYIDQQTGYVSFVFEGGGVWGPIIGVLTLEPDFETIKRISILQQEETPGLGGIVATRVYLDTFNGAKMVPSIYIDKDANPNLDNEIDSITGATRTSKAFELILNQAYQLHKTAWEQRN